MIKVLLADDHETFRRALASLIEDAPDLEICGEAADGQQAVAAALSTHPDVVLMDLSMPHLDGIAATRQICAAVEGARVVVLTSRSGLSLVREVGEAGARGYLVKGCPPEEVLEAVRAVYGGEQRLPLAN